MSNSRWEEEMVEMQAKGGPMSAEFVFAGFSPSRYWRLLFDGNRQDKEGPLGFDLSASESETGYMRSMFNGLNHLVMTMSAPISAEYFIKLREEAIKYNLYFYQKKLMKELSDQKLKEQSEPSLRSFGITNSHSVIGANLTEKGLKELVEKLKNGADYFKIEKRSLLNENVLQYDHKNIPSDETLQEIFKDMSSPESHWKITLSETDPAKIQKQMNVIIETYEQEIKEAKNDEDKKIRAIATCIHELELCHPFADGNCRTFCLLGLNKLLMAQGLLPCIPENPNQFDAFSIDELCVKIKEGQRNFEKEKKSGVDEKHSDVPCIFLENNFTLARFVALEIIKDCKDWHMIDAEERNHMVYLLTTLLSKNLYEKLPLNKIFSKIPQNIVDYLQWDSEARGLLSKQAITHGGFSSIELKSMMTALTKAIEKSLYDKNKSWLPTFFNKEKALPEYHIKFSDVDLAKTAAEGLQAAKKISQRSLTQSS